MVGFIIAEGCIVSLPLDVANTRTESNLDMKILWYVIFCTAMAFVVVVLPLGIFFYETDEDNDFKMRLFSAIKKETILFIICTLLITLSYAGLAFSTLPVQMNVCDNNPEETDEKLKVFQDPLTEALKPVVACNRVEEQITIKVSFCVYVAAIFAFVGWWMLFIYGGLGMTAVPLGLANDFRNRPAPMTEEKFTSKKNDLSQSVDILVKHGRYLL